MKTKVYIITGLLIVSLMGVITYQRNVIKKEKAEKEVYQENTHSLLSSVKFYKTKDSLNAVGVSKVELKLWEYELYRAEDLKLINSLKVDKKKLESVTTAQTKTIQELKGSVRDSIIYRDNHIVDTLRCITIREKWFDMNGCIDKQNEFTGSFENRDSLAIVNHVKQKRFLGFLWYFGKKEYRVDVVSKNPNTQITGIEYIEIRDYRSRY